MSAVRRRIRVKGIVQGVGFRPFVYRLAHLNSLSGFAGNNGEGVFIEVEGQDHRLDKFVISLRAEAPPLAEISEITSEQIPALGSVGFSIVESESAAECREALVSPDVAVCDACIQELSEPADRRYHHAFINCTDCGPRFTIIVDLPYDRRNTTMQAFQLCPNCSEEYEDPHSRRFHAESNACPDCGPHLSFLDWAAGGVARAGDPISRAAAALAEGAIVAVKGLGGYHLCCDAFSDAAVTKLRSRKSRDAKPFALMVPDVQTAAVLCDFARAEVAELVSVQRPIVLARRREDCGISAAVAPGSDTLGVMLPYTPLHYLLLDRFRRVATGAGPLALVMTSANASDEPIIYRDDAHDRLRSMADGALVHDRVIHMRCDDSVVQMSGDGMMFLRRSRGYAPAPLTLPGPAPAPILAVGAHLKNTFCLLKGDKAFVSHHIGDLESKDAYESFQLAVEHYQHIFGIAPEIVAHDLHPRYASTRYALRRGAPVTFGVQHHEAHIASVMAERCITEPVIGIAADGTGYGWDGTVWGGEFFIGDSGSFERFAYLATVPMPGGEQAVRQPWRLGAVYLLNAFGRDFVELELGFCKTIDPLKWHVMERMIERGVESPQTSSIGRLFDAVAAIVGLRNEVHYEGQAAIELETQATRFCGAGRSRHAARTEGAGMYHVAFPQAGGPIDVKPMICMIVRDLERGLTIPEIAFRFHEAVAEMLIDGCLAARRRSSLRQVILSGGVFQNLLLLELLVPRLRSSGFDVVTSRLLPPNDGGISLGQAAIAAARIAGC